MRNLFSKCDCILLFNGEPAEAPNANFYRHSGCDADGAILILKKSSKLMLVPKMNYKKAKSQCRFPVLAYTQKSVKKILKKKASGRVGIDENSVSAARYLRLKKLLRKPLVRASAQLAGERAIKTGAEIKKIRKAASIAKKILNEIEAHLSPQRTELEIVKKLRMLCLERGASPSFPPIVAAGKNSSIPHHNAGASRLGKGVVLIDFGVRHEGYCSDLTRCFFLGKCKKEREKYAQAREIFIGIKKEIPRLKTAGALSKFSASLCKKAGWGNMIHAIGHGIGLEVHEAPRLSASSKEPLAPGVALAIEPGWYGRDFGVRYEQDILIGKKGAILL